ncbi:polysaccharide deacetylase family protein [Microbacterium sp. SLBN-146]|uniref:polysaccharide deacetylase family protein n=1 Tax=Microbacterium sp. SLBN-146 TaxID=2768457 RepID=UPI0011548DAB|nr:polysaccharide deacetylase family protein [Microbacterium sp. SLBN-146]TQJ30611.1 polysaccharide deacetylase [Microbacterium sp. SLBN-146]
MTVHICFHGIGVCRTEREPGEAKYWMAESVFRHVLDVIAAHADVEISFDDGNRSDADVALPALDERGLDATFFALAGRLDDDASLSADDLESLRRHGMLIGNHGWGHIPWRGLSPAEETREFVEARRALEDASGAAVTTAALPLGRYDRRTLAALRDRGYAHVYTSDRHPSRRTSWLQARYSVTATDTPDSIARIVAGGGRAESAVNYAKSLVKRLR